MEIGLDITENKYFEANLKLGGENLLQRMFLAEELIDRELNSLIGIFTAKEAIIKTGVINPDEWLQVKISKHASGKPEVYIYRNSRWLKEERLKISITHTDHYAAAVAILLD